MTSRIYFLITVFLIAQSNFVLAEETPMFDLRYERWELSRHGEKLVEITELAELIRLWSENTGKVFEIRYPGGEEGELWVHEFMDWLIALGVPSSVMHAVPGSGNKDIIKIVLIQGKQTNE